MADKILIVDDDAEIRSELKDFLDGYEVLEASNGPDALKILRRANEVGLVILDVMMPGLNGLDVLTEIKRMDSKLSIIILTGHSSKDVAIEALKGRADDYLEKPVGIGRLKESVDRLLGAGCAKGDIGALDLKGKIEKVKSFIERNCYKKVTLIDAAASVCLSPKYLSRIFKEVAKEGFNEYKLAIKIDRAKGLLKKSGYNINQISDKLGYENAESFIRQFKKMTGFTPTAYRNKINKDKKSKARPRKHKGRL